MQVKELTKNQFLVTITASEHLIIDAYASVFGLTLQESALTMCVAGWNSYAKMIMQYSRNCSLVPSSSASSKVLNNARAVRYHSDEGVRYREFIAQAKKLIEEEHHGNPDSMAD